MEHSPVPGSRVSRQRAVGAVAVHGSDVPTTCVVSRRPCPSSVEAAHPPPFELPMRPRPGREMPCRHGAVIHCYRVMVYGDLAPPMFPTGKHAVMSVRERCDGSWRLQMEICSQ